MFASFLELKEQAFLHYILEGIFVVENWKRLNVKKISNPHNPIIHTKEVNTFLGQ